MLDPVRWINNDGKIFENPAPSNSLMPGKLRLIDQTLLPETLQYIETDDLDTVFDSIKRLAVRGAPAIGCAAALGLAAAAQKIQTGKKSEFIAEVTEYASRLAESRPTAVNLFWALKRCENKINSLPEEENVEKLKEELVLEALNILGEDISMCKKIGENGAELLKNGMTVLTHCNAGALATGDFGTALSPIYTASLQGRKIKVYSDETRPLLQGSRLTAWELQKAGVEVVTICDNMAGQVMKENRIDIVIVGADRVAANGDAANKIGTYSLAILAEYHKIPFYVAIPYSTVDMSLKDGSLIPIEERAPEEIKKGFGKLTAPAEVSVYNPAFDVTPNLLITGIITEKGIIKPPYAEKFRKLFSK